MEVEVNSFSFAICVGRSTTPLSWKSTKTPNKSLKHQIKAPLIQRKTIKASHTHLSPMQPNLLIHQNPNPPNLNLHTKISDATRKDKKDDLKISELMYNV